MKIKTLCFFFFCSGLFFSCQKDDDDIKWKHFPNNPLSSFDLSAEGRFEIRSTNSLFPYGSFSLYGTVMENSYNGFTVDNGILHLGDLPVNASTYDDYYFYQSADSGMKNLFGQNNIYSIGFNGQPFFTVSHTGPQEIYVTSPILDTVTWENYVYKSTLLEWNADSLNTFGIVIEIADHQSWKFDYLLVPDNGKVEFNALWPYLPKNSSFGISLYRGNKFTVTGTDSRDYLFTITTQYMAGSYTAVE